MSTQKKNTTKRQKPKRSLRKFLPWVFIAIICAVFIAGYKAYFDPKLDPNGDNINYFLLAKSLAEGQGYKDIVPPIPVPHTHFPPGYPMFMALFMHIFPENIIAMKILNGILFLIAILMLFRIIQRVTDDNIWIAFATCLLSVVHPTLMRGSVIMMSEMLYMVISFGIILICLDLDVGKAFARKGERDWKHVALFVLLCLLVISSYLVRTMGISVVLAASLAFAVTALKRLKLKDCRWMASAMTVVAILVTLVVAHEGWSIRNHHVAPGSRSDYSSGFLYTSDHQEMTAKLWVKRLKTNVSEYTTSWIPLSFLNPYETLDHHDHRTPTAAGWLLGLAVLFLMGLGGYRLKRGRILILSYVLITFGVLLLYQEQYTGIRYFTPVLPLMILLLLNGVWEAFTLPLKHIFNKEIPLVPIAVLALAAFLFYPGYKKTRDLYVKTASYKTFIEMNPKSSYAHYLQAAEWLKEHGTNATVVACRKPETMFIYSGYKHAVRFPTSGTEEEVLKALDSSPANCLVLDTYAKHAYSVIYPAIKEHQDAFPVYFATEQDNEVAPTAVTAIIRSKL